MAQHGVGHVHPSAKVSKCQVSSGWLGAISKLIVRLRSVATSIGVFTYQAVPSDEIGCQLRVTHVSMCQIVDVRI